MVTKQKGNVLAKEMLINVAQEEECRIAIIEGGKLDELYFERAANLSHVGNIYKGKITNQDVPDFGPKNNFVGYLRWSAAFMRS